METPICNQIEAKVAIVLPYDNYITLDFVKFYGLKWEWKINFGVGNQHRSWLP